MVAASIHMGELNNGGYDDDDDELVEFEDVSEKNLIERLINDDDKSLRMISLVSEDAMGKTALARKIPMELLKGVELMSVDELSALHFQTLMELRFLIVLDNVFSFDVWLMLACPFADVANGNRVNLTTRDSKIASDVDLWSHPSLGIVLEQVSLRRLLQLWIAEVFMKMSSTQQPKDIASKYLKELVCRNMIEIATRKEDGRHKTCRMPSLLHDFFFPKSKDIEFIHAHHCKENYVCFKAQKRGTSNEEINELLKTIINRRRSRGFVLMKISKKTSKEAPDENPNTQVEDLEATLIGLLIDFVDPKEYGLNGFTSLRKLGLICHSRSLAEKIADCISQLNKLQTFKLRSRDHQFGQPSKLMILDNLTTHPSLSNLYLFRVFEVGNLPKNLKTLTLSMSKIENDPMLNLGKCLPQLNILRLFADSFVEKNMNCLGGGFPKLRVLKLWVLENLKE
ncbi:uncharacterized protein LOC114265785 [Camellia sinensis]|uniref:uncharacterized protein LOC114265785 n=1 Tax=Camellia sinensis TaxID=4442 RepID=UPI001036061C|nr:uncharacterized protein LOC114265785 [Camellia sinensis]